MDYSNINQGVYPIKPYFKSKTEKAVLLMMTAVDIMVVAYCLFYLTWNGN